MEVSLAALMRNLHVQLRVNLGTVWLFSPVFNYLAKVLFILLHKNQPGVWTQNLQSPEKPFRGQYSLCCQGVAWESLCWFSSRQGRQCAVDLRNGSSQARAMQLCGEVATMAGHSCWVIFPWLRPCSVAPCPLIPELGLELQLWTCN